LFSFVQTLPNLPINSYFSLTFWCAWIGSVDRMGMRFSSNMKCIFLFGNFLLIISLFGWVRNCHVRICTCFCKDIGRFMRSFCKVKSCIFVHFFTDILLITLGFMNYSHHQLKHSSKNNSHFVFFLKTHLFFYSNLPSLTFLYIIII